MGTACVLVALPVAALQPGPRQDAVVAADAALRVAATSLPLEAIVAARLTSLDSICAITNGRTRGELLVALADQWVDDARFLKAYFGVLDGIPDARVRAEVVEHALAASPTTATRAHARAIIEGLPDRRLREAMSMRLDAMYATAGGSP
jgi:hypothetical protein